MNPASDASPTREDTGLEERCPAADHMHGGSERYERQRRSLMRLMRSGALQAVDLDAVLREITTEIARTMNVERVSVWRFNEERSAIVCLELFEASLERHSSGIELHCREFPCYFHALKENEMISADDARADPRTSEFTERYLVPLGITSMLDAPLHAGGELVGVLCHEHVGPQRAWTRDEQSFSVSMANFVSLVFAQWEHRRIEEQLRQQASLLDKAQDAIIVRDLDHKVCYWNKSAARLYGWTAEEVLGQDISRLIYTDAQAFHENTTRVLSDGEWTGEIHQVTKSGDELIVEARWTLVRDASGQPKSILAINTNITARRTLESQMLRVQRLESIGTLAGGIAHDLNNVLTPILMSIDLLKLRITDANSQTTLNTMATSARRGVEMIQQVLSFAEGVEGRRGPVQVHANLHDIMRLVRDTFPKNIHSTLQMPADLWTVRGDSTQIHQVLLNLCVNARDAMSGGGTLALTAENVIIDAQYAAQNIEARPGPCIVIHVQDDGHGIPAGNLDKIFDPFFTTKEAGKGTGLGLSTTLAIIRSHGGFIQTSSTLGHGTRFSVFLPADPGALPDQQEFENDEMIIHRGGNEIILVVDDEASVREITRQTLEAFGYRVLLAADGAEAVSLYSKRQHEIAVVLTDMMMPIMDGPATIQVLMKINPEVRTIAVGAVTTNAVLGQLAESGSVCVLPKPYSAGALLRVLRQVITGTPNDAPHSSPGGPSKSPSAFSIASAV